MNTSKLLQMLLKQWPTFIIAMLGAGAFGQGCATSQRATDRSPDRSQFEAWRAEHRIIDLHQHINSTTQHIARAARIMDRVGIGVAVNLSGGFVTRGTNANAVSPFERNKRLADKMFPGRFLQYM